MKNVKILLAALAIVLSLQSCSSKKCDCPTFKKKISVELFGLFK
jgi:hypothetical protein